MRPLEARSFSARRAHVPFTPKRSEIVEMVMSLLEGMVFISFSWVAASKRTALTVLFSFALALDHCAQSRRQKKKDLEW